MEGDACAGDSASVSAGKHEQRNGLCVYIDCIFVHAFVRVCVLCVFVFVCVVCVFVECVCVCVCVCVCIRV
jgi:hypothetical protein